ncbi:30S ribosomal protein S6 [Actinospongicola halichondriae]|uniref:30S ribosomal protein S6 n=1 Tax=Actinospongicola halichondriae TaxID=3236844 RepID=UPI003D5AF438
MRAYELMVIIDGELDESAATAQVTQIEGRLNEVGTVGSTDFWGRRTFAYEINHKTEGSYVVFEVLADPGALDEVERTLRLADEIVRHKVIRLPDHEAAKRGLIGSAAAE